MKPNDLLNIIEKYLAIFPDERSKLKQLIGQAKAGEQLNDRKNFRGHIAGDALIISPDHKKLLMVHHKFMKMWLQPGGHWDPDEPSPFVAAKREAKEETSVAIKKSLPIVPGDLVVPLHVMASVPIPPQPTKNEPSHYHHSFFYAFEAASESVNRRVAEVSELEWVGLDDSRLTLYDFRLIIAKLRRFKFI